MAVEIAAVDYGPERLVIELDAKGPVQLGELAESFHSLERLFQRQQRKESGDAPPQTRLFVSKIESGSIIAEIAPLLVFFSEPLAFMAATNTIKNFAENIIELLKKFGGRERGRTQQRWTSRSANIHQAADWSKGAGWDYPRKV